ncbi:MAG: hypothetical protein WAT19_16425 [Ferruginibacter sp.]
MKLSFVLLCCMLFGLVAPAQYNELIILKNGDTLKGDITYRNNFFKIITADGEIAYHASAVNNVNFSKFKGRVIFYKLYTHNANLQDIAAFNYESVYIDTTLFLTEIYHTKKMNLYSAKDSYKTDYYFVEKPADTIPTQLRVSFWVKTVDPNEQRILKNNDYVRTSLMQEKIYVGQLRILMSDCSNISNNEFEALDYRSYKFKSIIKAYNKKCL